MPRQPRIDAHGYLYHVIARGIERRSIFNDSRDKDYFLKKLGDITADTGTPVYAFALIPNHFHLLLRRMLVPVAQVMQRLLTSYAIYYNKKHRRVGYLFQNRYRSIICDEDVYFLELIRYINLNPLRAKVVGSLKELAWYRYCSHGHIMGVRNIEWFDPTKVLDSFAGSGDEARRAYVRFILEGMERGGREDLSGGGIRRSLAHQHLFLDNEPAFDQRILGLGDFVEKLRFAQSSLGADSESALMRIVSEVCNKFSVAESELMGRSRKRHVSSARALTAFRMQRELGMSQSEIAGRLAVTQPAVLKMIKRCPDPGSEYVDDLL